MKTAQKPARIREVKWQKPLFWQKTGYVLPRVGKKCRKSALLLTFLGNVENATFSKKSENLGRITPLFSKKSKKRHLPPWFCRGFAIFYKLLIKVLDPFFNHFPGRRVKTVDSALFSWSRPWCGTVLGAIMGTHRGRGGGGPPINNPGGGGGGPIYLPDVGGRVPFTSQMWGRATFTSKSGYFSTKSGYLVQKVVILVQKVVIFSTKSGYF